VICAFFFLTRRFGKKKRIETQEKRALAPSSKPRVTIAQKGKRRSENKRENSTHSMAKEEDKEEEKAAGEGGDEARAAAVGGNRIDGEEEENEKKKRNDEETKEKNGGGGGNPDGNNNTNDDDDVSKCPIDAFTGDNSAKKKRKIALFFGYNGDGYQGMQRNPGAKTIEDDLETAIVKAGGIAESNAGDFNKVHWNRAARTDKGVSAVGQVVSFKCMNADDGNTEKIVDLINEHLPKNIVAFGATRVTGGFSAKNQCDRRKYEYVVPVRAFDARFPKKRKPRNFVGDGGDGGDNNNNTTRENNDDENGAREKLDDVEDGKDGKEGEKEEENANDEDQQGEPYVFTEAERTKVNDILKHFVGTHNFHNYSTKVDCDTPQAKRFVISFSCSMPFKIEGEDFVKFEILGQSFLFNMIRKLVGMTIAVARDFCDVSDLLFALRTKQRVNTPMAPELGLFLCECQYDAYNKRFSAEREPLRLENWRDKVEAFKHETVYKHIYDREYVIKDNMGEWIRKFISDKHGFREHYDVAMHRALLKEEKLAPLSAKNSQKQRANSSQNQQGSKAPPKPSSEGDEDKKVKKDDSEDNNNNTTTTETTKHSAPPGPKPNADDDDQEALLLVAAKTAAERVARKRKLEIEKQEERKRREIEKHEERVRNGMVVGKAEYADDEMSE
jgi:tRNA pseudouridine38-40 synthase